MALPVQREIDARGSFCPGPLMELIRAVRGAEVGDLIAVLSKDPGSRTDIPAWLTKAGHDLVAAEDEEGYTRFVARKVR